MSVQEYKARALQTLPDEAGVYMLCDLDEMPIYVGQATSSKDTSIRKRVQRHLTSARSDVIANRQIDVWEVAYVWAWNIEDPDQRSELEGHLFHKYDTRSPLVNGRIPTDPGTPGWRMPDRVRVQVMSDEIIKARRDPALRFPRQIQHFGALVDYVLNTQDKPHLRRAIDVYFERLQRYHRAFVNR